MKNNLDDERTVLTRLMPNLQRLQNDSSGLIQWIVTLNDQECLVLMHWAKSHAPWLLSAIRRVPRPSSCAPQAVELEREVAA